MQEINFAVSSDFQFASSRSTLGCEFISRVQDLQNSIDSFRYTGYEEDIERLAFIVAAYRQDVITEGLTVYAGYYEEALKQVEQNAISRAAAMSVEDTAPGR